MAVFGKISRSADAFNPSLVDPELTPIAQKTKKATPWNLPTGRVSTPDQIASGFFNVAQGNEQVPAGNYAWTQTPVSPPTSPVKQASQASYQYPYAQAAPSIPPGATQLPGGRVIGPNTGGPVTTPGGRVLTPLTAAEQAEVANVGYNAAGEPNPSTVVGGHLVPGFMTPSGKIVNPNDPAQVAKWLEFFPGRTTLPTYEEIFPSNYGPYASAELAAQAAAGIPTTLAEQRAAGWTYPRVTSAYSGPSAAEQMAMMQKTFA